MWRFIWKNIFMSLMFQLLWNVVTPYHINFFPTLQIFSSIILHFFFFLPSFLLKSQSKLRRISCCIGQKFTLCHRKMFKFCHVNSAIFMHIREWFWAYILLDFLSKLFHLTHHWISYYHQVLHSTILFCWNYNLDHWIHQ